MSSKSLSKEQRDAERDAKIAAELEWNRTVLPVNTLFQLARANELNLEYSVKFNNDKSAVVVEIVAGEHDLGYRDDESVTVYAHPRADGFHYIPSYHFDSFVSINDRVIKHKEEQRRMREVRLAALAKLTDEEKKALGLK